MLNSWVGDFFVQRTIRIVAIEMFTPDSVMTHPPHVELGSMSANCLYNIGISYVTIACFSFLLTLYGLDCYNNQNYR